MKKMIEAQNITKDFRPPVSLRQIFRPGPGTLGTTRALDDISFSLESGKLLCVLGPNGAGKTTLLKIIAGLILPDMGALTVDGLIHERDDERIRSMIGLSSFHEKGFYWRLTGRQNLEFFAAMYGLDSRAARERLKKLFGLFGVTYQNKRFDAYSAGMKQKIAIIRALLNDPRLLLFDEPTKSLDYGSSFRLMHLIKDTLVGKEGKTVIFTTHHMDEAAEFAHVFLILHNGRLLDAGTIDELRQRVNKPAASLGEIYVSLTRDRPC
ncbi:MAG: ABC transporter ATP-binding protein [Candidatus Omnitrophica bacterium]|nr:ABC transporter ATP-binding protein [Candidatus Omnitrophota bacterium]